MPWTCILQLPVYAEHSNMSILKIAPKTHVLGEFSRQAWQVTSHPKSPRTTGNEAAREALISNIAHWKSNQESNKLNMSFLSVPNLVPWLICRAWQGGGGGGDKRKRRWREGLGRGDYLREAILLSFFLKGGRLIEGRLLFEEIRKPHPGPLS